MKTSLEITKVIITILVMIVLFLPCLFFSWHKETYEEYLKKIGMEKDPTKRKLLERDFKIFKRRMFVPQLISFIMGGVFYKLILIK